MQVALLPLAKPFVKDAFTHTHVRVDVDYKKGHGPELSFRLVEVGADRFVKFSVFSSPRASIVLEAWKTNSMKKLNALDDELTANLKARSGRGWDELQEFSRKVGFVLQGQEKELGNGGSGSSTEGASEVQV